MEIREISSLAGKAQDLGDGATVTPLYPSANLGQGIVAVDLWEIAPGGTLQRHAHGEEHVLFVLSGQGRIIAGGQDGVVATLRENTVVYLAPNEDHQLRSTGNAPLRVLVSTPLLVRSERASGVMGTRQAVGATGSPRSESVRDSAPAPVEAPPQRIAERPARSEAAPPASPQSNREEAQPAQARPSRTGPDTQPEDEQSSANIVGLMRRASELKDQPRPERRRAAHPPEEAPQAEEEQPQDESQPEEEAEEQNNLMELFVAFDGDTRGKDSQGFGRYLVQAPGRKAIVKSAEFDANYTPAQAQYESLVECLRYIGARLEATGRSPEQIQLDIRVDNESIVNGLLGTMKVKEPALKKKQEQALDLLSHFADWRIEWHSPEESSRLLG